MSSPPPDPFVPPVWAPSVQDVAALLRARTKDDSGREAGDFTDTTRPTGDEVSRLIVMGCADLIANLGTDVPDSLQPEARALAALKTALYIEQSYWPEQVASDRSSWNEMWQMYQYELQNLKEAAASGGGGSTIGAGSLCTSVNWGSCDDGTPWPIDWWQRDLDYPGSVSGTVSPH